MAQGHYPLNGNTHPTGNPSFPDMEEATLKYWDEHDIFAKSVNERAAGNRGDNEFVFYDGPPFANGLPHYGHLLTGYIKDIVGRYQTMLGHRVERRFGWDTHGLPAELEAQRLLGIDDVSEITKPGGLGIEKFNAECRSSVLRYTDEWQDYVTRQARWVDFDDDYKTLDITYMESVLWAFKTLYDKGLAYEGYRVLPYCWHDRTPLSNHELKMDDDVYQDRTDQSVTVGLRMESGELALIWTTTPWTLPSNLAITVGPDIEYVTVVPQEGELAGESSRMTCWRPTARNWAKVRRSKPPILALSWSDGAMHRFLTTSIPMNAALKARRPDRTHGPSSLATSSPLRTAPAWCTQHRHLVKTT